MAQRFHDFGHLSKLGYIFSAVGDLPGYVDFHRLHSFFRLVIHPASWYNADNGRLPPFTDNADLNRFADWLHENNCLDVCMKSTVIANPKWVKAVKGNKDDTKDSKRIGDLFRIGLAKSSFIPVKDIRILRELTRCRYKLTSIKSSEKNRFQNAFTVCSVVLDSVVSDMFGKSATAITIT